MMDANNSVQAAVGGVILDRGVRYKIGEDEGVILRPLRFGTLLLIAQMVAESGLTQERMTEGENDHFRLFAEFGELMLRCVAAAELNDKEKLSDSRIDERAGYYRDSLNAFQVYELFVHVLNLSGIQSFKNTISLLLTLKERTLSPKVQGS
jgi:hypothetical protein